MEKLIIDNSESLLNAISLIHDSGFKIADIDYRPIEKTFSINTKEYEYKGNFVQKQTDKVIAKHRLMFSCDRWQGQL